MEAGEAGEGCQALACRHADAQRFVALAVYRSTVPHSMQTRHTLRSQALCTGGRERVHAQCCWRGGSHVPLAVRVPHWDLHEDGLYAVAPRCVAVPLPLPAGVEWDGMGWDGMWYFMVRVKHEENVQGVK